MTEKGDEFYRQVSESIKLVFNLTSKIDERVEFLVKQSTNKIDKLFERQESIENRISIIEKDNIREIKTLQIKMASLSENKYKIVIDFIFKISIVLIGGFLTWKIGIR